ncbi:MAG: stage III sporulation protein AF [Lachnospiraceae bacterium]|nr:stage III sporulation protein AF [Lachnospiraceae bacterium]
MEAVYEWIRSLVFYLILMTTVLNFLPDRKYEKYLRLFTGMVFILLVFGPLGDLTGLEERMAGAFGRITFQNDVKLLQREIADADGTRMKRLADRYRRAVETDLMTMAESAGLECRQAEAVVEEDPERPGFGSVLEVKLIVGIPGSGDPGPLEGDTEAFRGQGAETWSREENGREAGLERRRRANREIGNLKTRIGEYYGVEEGRIRIDLEDE